MKRIVFIAGIVLAITAMVLVTRQAKKRNPAKA